MKDERDSIAVVGDRWEFITSNMTHRTQEVGVKRVVDSVQKVREVSLNRGGSW